MSTAIVPPPKTTLLTIKGLNDYVLNKQIRLKLLTLYLQLCVIIPSSKGGWVIDCWGHEYMTRKRWRKYEKLRFFDSKACLLPIVLITPLDEETLKEIPSKFMHHRLYQCYGVNE